ncbi:SEC-C metal-binding domain-containing protein [Comamonas thiooxydans]|uniref:SEC-C metal-binding domain-containing protein n=1 Tax=Comamonas thiooxydans TaxID=363952 RepID=UPI00244ABC5C|nr:SEC-C metal-binding domain-containing protein [Comamonas thiooxydans]MDH1477473.1 SEC-C metal-binding domain-containing protein [Comamonas thiooxydans]
MKARQSRLESEIFADLRSLCVKPGYIHTLAFLCFRDNVIPYAGEMKEADMRRMFQPSRLIRTEINTLFGLMVKAEVDWSLPSPLVQQEYLSSSESLLEELHRALSGVWLQGLTAAAVESRSFNPFERAEALREPIFYGGESAYHFQYVELAATRYASDAAWLQEHCGYSIQEAAIVARAVERVNAAKFISLREEMRKLHPDQWTMLPFFTVSVAEVSAEAKAAPETVERILGSFTLPPSERNTGFNALNDFNVVAATPLLRTPTGEFISLQAYSLAEALYDAPFYWMAQDKAYLPTLARNRGAFTENYVAERLRLVFGAASVFPNVDIYRGKVKIGEIDVLVVWGNRAVVVQSKSKRLTLEARKGNDQVIRVDFQKSVQDAYDQAVLCAKHLDDGNHRLQALDGREVTVPNTLEEIYVVCVVSDHYPALSFQALQYLKTVTINRVQPPLVCDVFTVDVMSEMLRSPLHFLSYLNRRVNYGDKLLASHELTILAYHLKHNLWLDPEVGMMFLSDDFSAGLDIAMGVRRAGLQGAATPDGILTRFDATTLGYIVKDIEARPEAATIDLGFLLLSLSEDTVRSASRAIDRICALARTDHRHHDLTLAFGSSEAGLTIHCNEDPTPIALSQLRSYCERRKYKEAAPRWFGLCMDPKSTKVRFGVSLSYPWIKSDEMDKATKDMQSPRPTKTALDSLLSDKLIRKKVGRNDTCPCGSGLKYKKCCLT